MKVVYLKDTSGGYGEYSEPEICVEELSVLQVEPWGEIISTLFDLVEHNKQVRELFDQYRKNKKLLTEAEFRKTVDQKVVFKDQYYYARQGYLSNVQFASNGQMYDYQLKDFVEGVGGETFFVAIEPNKIIKDQVAEYTSKKQALKEKSAARKQQKEVEKAKKILERAAKKTEVCA
jgi:hypothetical protein